MKLFLINPRNRLGSLNYKEKGFWSQFTSWKPLALLTLASLTPSDWEVTLIDENIDTPDYATMPTPDLVGISVFTSQADRAYSLASYFRNRGITVVGGGIHVSMRTSEALQYMDTVVKGEAENVWADVLKDARQKCLKNIYVGTPADMNMVPITRHDLLPRSYFFGAIQTTRGCPLNCSFCSVTAFNGKKIRHRSIKQVIQEFKSIPEKYMIIYDENFNGTSKDHIARTKELLQAMIDANLGKRWVAQTTINIADDEELLALASRAGCFAVFIGFESPSREGLMEVGKRFNLQGNRNMTSAVRRIQSHGIFVIASVIIGLDVDKKGIGKEVARAIDSYGADIISPHILTPFPGTRLWDKWESENRIVANNFPKDWKYYTVGFPVAKFEHLSSSDIIKEWESSNQHFYSRARILRRLLRNFFLTRQFLIPFVMSLVFRNTMRLYNKIYKDFDLSH